MTIPSDRQVTNYTISDFWNQRLGETIPVGPKTLIQGWSFQDQGLETFKEAPLTLSKEVGVEDNPLESLLLLVSAPGAVGKTTLARQIAFHTGSIYIDLSEAAPVGANTLIGGIANPMCKFYHASSLSNWSGGFPCS